MCKGSNRAQVRTVVDQFGEEDSLNFSQFCRLLASPGAVIGVSSVCDCARPVQDRRVADSRGEVGPHLHLRLSAAGSAGVPDLLRNGRDHHERAVLQALQCGEHLQKARVQWVRTRGGMYYSAALVQPKLVYPEVEQPNLVQPIVQH